MDGKHDWHGQSGEPEDKAPAPWDDEAYGGTGGEEAARPARHDAFTPGRRRIFLKHLAKTGCIADAARLTGVTARTVYNHQEKDAEFARHCELAISMAGGGIEQIAYERAVSGVPEQFACGGKVYTRTRYSEGLLRLLLQGANPKKYGARPGFTRKRLWKWERDEIEREVRARIQSQLRADPAETTEAILRHLDVLERRQAPERLAAGWTKTDEGEWIPPGWVRDPDYVPPPSESEGDETPRDSV